MVEALPLHDSRQDTTHLNDVRAVRFQERLSDTTKHR